MFRDQQVSYLGWSEVSGGQSGQTDKVAVLEPRGPRGGRGDDKAWTSSSVPCRRGGRKGFSRCALIPSGETR